MIQNMILLIIISMNILMIFIIFKISIKYQHETEIYMPGQIHDNLTTSNNTLK